LTTRLILVSHALTRWNVAGRIQGHTDIPLNTDGLKMSQALAQKLSCETIHAIYTSDLQRAVQTARATATQKFLPIIQDKGLREGRSSDQERSSRYPTLPFDVEVETITDLRKRIRKTLTRICQTHDHQTVLAVSHGGALEYFIKDLLDESGTGLSAYHGIRMALNRFSYAAEKFTITRLNEADFLTAGIGR
jgi:broad specificity phosphatase PhoE